MLGERLAIERDAQRGDALSARDRSDDRLLGNDIGLELSGLALRHGDIEVALHAGLDCVLRALPYVERAHHFAAAEELHVIEELIAPVEELERFLGACRLGGRAEQYGDEPPGSALG